MYEESGTELCVSSEVLQLDGVDEKQMACRGNVCTVLCSHKQSSEAHKGDQNDEAQESQASGLKASRDYQ